MNEEYKSEKIEVKIDRQKDCIVKLEVKASSALVTEAQKKAIKEVSKEIALPGFRKGKAPVEMLLKQYGPNIEQTWQKKIADLSFIEAQKLIKIFPLNSSTTISFDLKSHSLEKGAELSFSYETEPSVPKVDTSKFKLKSFPEPKIEEEKIDETIRQAQFFYAKWEEVNRPIKESDYVIIDLYAIDSDPPVKVFDQTRFEIKDKSLAKWMKGLLLGAKRGDVLEGISKPDEELPEEEKKHFQPKKVRIDILKVEEAILPTLNDEFAKKIGAKDIEEMRKNVSEMLKKQEEAMIEKQKKEEVSKFLVENSNFELPLTLIQSETKYRKDQALHDSRFKRKWDKMSEQEKKTFEEEIQKQAKDAVALFYLSKKIVNDANISITQKEVHDEIIRTIEASTPLGKEPNLQNISQELYALCLSKIIMSKAQDWVLSQSK